MCTCGEGCMLVLIPCDCPVLIAALLVCLDWHHKWHRQTPDEQQSLCHRLNSRLKCPYPVSSCFTHNTLVGFPVWLSVCTFLIEFKPLSTLPRYLKCLILFGERMKHLGRNKSCTSILWLFARLETLWIDQTARALCAISLLWRHTDDVINLLQPLYIMADIFTVDGTLNGPSASHQGRDSITALVTHNSLSLSLSHTHTHTHAVSHLFTKKVFLSQRTHTHTYWTTTVHVFRWCVSFPMRAFRVFRVEECVLSWSLRW